MEQAGHLIAGLAGKADHRADLAGPGLSQLGHARLQEIADLLQVHPALGRAHARPGPLVERLARCGDRKVDIPHGRLDIFEDGLLGVRCHHLKHDIAAARAPLAIDEQAGGAARLDATDGL